MADFPLDGIVLSLYGLFAAMVLGLVVDPIDMLKAAAEIISDFMLFLRAREENESMYYLLFLLS